MSRNIESAVTFIEQHKSCDAEEVLKDFRLSTGAGLHFRHGTHELTYCGVKGTATSGAPSQLLRSWTRAARKRLAKAGAR